MVSRIDFVSLQAIVLWVDDSLVTCLLVTWPIIEHGMPSINGYHEHVDMGAHV